MVSETEALLVLNAVKGLGNAGIRKLLKFYGSAIHVLSLSEDSLAQASIIPSKVIQNIYDFSQDKFLETEYNLMTKHHVKAVTWLDDDYPVLLREIPGAPVVLYVKGDLPRELPLSIGIVGSRKASLYGVATAEKFATQLAELGFTIVSGLARGIDAAAHKGALKGSGKTIAVLGCGLSHVYPLENRDLLKKIESNDGAVISEFPMQMRPMAYNFPRRNRIVSGLSMGVIVVEAAQRSGALITADYALEQGRNVYAIPGKIDQFASQGVNNLIKQGAKLITSVQDVLEDIQPHVESVIATNRVFAVANIKELANTKKDVSEEQLKRLTEEEKLIYQNITDRPVHIDDLANSYEASVPVMSILLQLELKQLVKQLPGKLFVR